METWRRVEVAACRGDERARPRTTSRRSGRATFTVEAVNEREKVTDHDVDGVRRRARLRRATCWALDPLRPDVVGRARHGARAPASRCGGRDRGARTRASSSRVLAARAREHMDTVCIGRTHGMHAEPTTFGIKLAGFALEASPQDRLARATDGGVGRGDLGAVGTYSRRDQVRARSWGGSASRGAGQEPDRRRAIATPPSAGDGAPRRGHRAAATEIRHLQRTEVREAEEAFPAATKGSSAMPHKRNPIMSERISGLARVLRGYAAGRGGERRPLARARHHALRPSA